MTFVVTSLVFVNSPFWRLFNRRNKEVTSPGNMTDAPKPSVVLGKVLFAYQQPVCMCIVMLKKSAVRVFVKNTVKTSNRCSYFHWYIQNTVSSVTSCNTECTHSLFSSSVEGDSLPLHGLSLTLTWALQKRLCMQLINLHFIRCHHTICFKYSSHLWYLYSKT
jgi:hypothetical protein